MPYPVLKRILRTSLWCCIERYRRDCHLPHLVGHSLNTCLSLFSLSTRNSNASSKEVVCFFKKVLSYFRLRNNGSPQKRYNASSCVQVVEGEERKTLVDEGVTFSGVVSISAFDLSPNQTHYVKYLFLFV